MTSFGLKRWAATALAILAAHAAHAAHAQGIRRSGGDGGPGVPGIPRDERFPYAGVWTGMRVMELGSDQITFSFTVAHDQYAGAMIFPNGGKAPHQNLAASAAGLTWESPNSGGGTWVYRVHLASVDSLVGTLMLRDPPANLTPAPKGTVVLKRQPPPAARRPQ